MPEKRRTAIVCNVCGRRKHRSCPTCGAEKLLGFKGTFGLFAHATGAEPRAEYLHKCLKAPQPQVPDPAAIRTPRLEPPVHFAVDVPAETAAEMTGPSVIADAIFEELKPRLGDAIDGEKIVNRARDAAASVVRAGMTDIEKQARAAAIEALNTSGALPVEIRAPGQPPKNIGRQHCMFPTLLAVMATRTPVWLVGPAGSGKTVGVGAAAEALSLGFYPKSIGPATTEHAIMGYNDATGVYVPGILFEPFCNGGVMLWDEIDAGHPAALTTLNTAISNDYCSFPHEIVAKHPDCIMVAAANTVGRGADRQYVGRAQLDSATLDRFAIIEWDYDTGFEAALAAGYAVAAPEHETAILAWCQRVQVLRASNENIGARIVFSTRAIANGAKLIVGGMDPGEIEEILLWNGADADTASKIKAGVPS